MSQQERWEDVYSPSDSDYLERIRVPGGWLYRSLWRETPNALAGKKPAVAVALTFVPVPPGYRAE
jgi:hypothetical protein